MTTNWYTPDLLMYMASMLSTMVISIQLLRSPMMAQTVHLAWQPLDQIINVPALTRRLNTGQQDLLVSKLPT